MFVDYSQSVVIILVTLFTARSGCCLIQNEFSHAKIRLIEHHRQQMLAEKQRFVSDFLFL